MTYKTPEVAQAARTTLRTIRHWENAGLLGKVARDRRGDRAFTPAQMDRAKMISAASMAGMGLDEIKKASALVLVARISDACAFMESVRDAGRSFDL